MTIGERIQIRRTELGMSQDALAKKMGYSGKTVISKVENNGNNITTDRIAKFADALMVTPAYLMGWESEQHKYDYVNTDLIAKFIKDKSRMDFLITYEQLNEENKNKVNDIASALLLAQEKL